jgi:hypothetical protein
MEHISMTKIGQFRNVVKPIIDAARFVGVDENGEPIFNETKPPVLTFTGTVKLHGTCAAVCYDGKEIWAQSKNNIITPEQDNAGFAGFVYNNQEYFEKLMKSLYTGDTIALFGEWAGKGVQAKVAISNIHKSFFIFGLKVPGKGWLPLDFELGDRPNVFKLTDFKTYEVEIDFDNPRLSQNKIVGMVEEVEAECPVAKMFGFPGIGEGIVFETTFKGKRFVFKAKGEKHAGSKVKKLNKVDDAKLQLIQDVAEKVTPAWRLEQMWNETFDIINGGEPTIKKTGDFLKAVSQDVMKEDMDILEENGLTMKDVGGTVSKIARRWFMEKLDNEILGE